MEVLSLKNKIKLVPALIIIIVLLLLYIVYSAVAIPWFNEYKQTIYFQGVNDGQLFLIQDQMQTGNIQIIYNNTIQPIPLNQLCGGEING